MDLYSPTTQTWMNIFFGIVGVFGTVLATFSILDRRSKRPWWHITTTPLIIDSISQIAGLDIRYNGQKIANLSQTNVKFWNSGKDPIRKSDIAPGDPLRLEIAEAVDVYNVSRPDTNNPPSRPELVFEMEGGNVAFTFDYLERNQGIVFTVYHGSSKDGDFKVTGTVIGARTRRFPIEAYMRRPGTWAALTDELITLVTLIPVFGTAVLVALLTIQLTDLVYLGAIIGWIVGIGGMFMARKVHSKLAIRPPIPEGL